MNFYRRRRRGSSKYGNIQRTCSQDHVHDSAKEARYCNILELRRKAGEIEKYQTQVDFELHPTFKDASGETVRGTKYIADFLVIHKDGRAEIVDVKGVRTPLFNLKWKLLKLKLKDMPEYIFTLE